MRVSVKNRARILYMVDLVNRIIVPVQSWDARKSVEFLMALQMHGVNVRTKLV